MTSVSFRAGRREDLEGMAVATSGRSELVERERKTRELAERESKRERRRERNQQGKKKKACSFPEREREPSPQLFDGQLSFIVSSRARERRRAREELESSAWGERERERESRKRFSKLLFSSESGSSLEEISRLHKLTFFYLFSKKNKKNSAASVAALLVAGSALTAVSAAPQPGSDEDVQSREADYSHFAEM